jgi:hypothetical protein
VQGNEFWDKVKKIAMASFAMKATERDPDFVDNFCAAVRKNSKVRVCCCCGWGAGQVRPLAHRAARSPTL